MTGRGQGRCAMRANRTDVPVTVQDAGVVGGRGRGGCGAGKGRGRGRCGGGNRGRFGAM